MRIAAIALLLLANAAWAHEDHAVELSPELEKVAKKLEGDLIAPCCWRAPVADHHSPAANEVRAEVRQMLAKGQSEEQILAYYENQYGPQILSSPPAEGFHLLAWVLPFLALALGGFGLAIFLRQHRRASASKEQPASQPAREPSQGDDRYARMLREELEEN